MLDVRCEIGDGAPIMGDGLCRLGQSPSIRTTVIVVAHAKHGLGGTEGRDTGYGILLFYRRRAQQHFIALAMELQL